MTKDAWLEHIRNATGKSLPTTADYASHRAENPDCPMCKARAKTRKANANRKGRDEAYRSCGMTKVRGALGGTYWE
jgi:hypothetical protein